MKDEIKEILYLEKYIDKYKSDEKSIINGNRLTSPAMLDYLEVKNLLDYITNLQEENERLKEENKRIFSKVNDDELLISNAMNYAKAQEYKSRNENAIELIKSLIIFWKKYTPDNTMEIGQFENVLSTLQGDDKDE